MSICKVEHSEFFLWCSREWTWKISLPSLEALFFRGHCVEIIRYEVLFLLIGLKLSIEGATPNLCGVLLLLRQGLVMMAVKTFLLLSGIQSVQIQLLITLASQAATSVVGLGQITKAKDRGDEGYNTDFAFDIIGISFPLTILLNTAACLGGSAYIASMYPISLVLVALSGLLYKVHSLLRMFVA